MNDNHKKRMVAPAVITALFLLYLVVYLVAVILTMKFSPGMRAAGI